MSLTSRISNSLDQPNQSSFYHHLKESCDHHELHVNSEESEEESEEEDGDEDDMTHDHLIAKTLTNSSIHFNITNSM